MRRVRDISAEENFRLERKGGFNVCRRDPIEPEPVGTLIIKAFRISGYDQDCDGSLMARLTNIGFDGDSTGWEAHAVGLDPTTAVVVSEEELRRLGAEEASREA